MKVTIEMGADAVTSEFDDGATVKALIEAGHLRGVAEAATRINGIPADEDSFLSDGDVVSQNKRSGVQGS